MLNDLCISDEPSKTKLARPMTHYRNIITLESGKRGGKPCMRGRGLPFTTFWTILLASGISPEEILKNFPYLTAEDIQTLLLISCIIVK